MNEEQTQGDDSLQAFFGEWIATWNPKRAKKSTLSIAFVTLAQLQEELFQGLTRKSIRQMTKIWKLLFKDDRCMIFFLVYTVLSEKQDPLVSSSEF